MTAIWLLSTRGRPKEAQATIDACAETGMRSHGVVFVDGGHYPKLRLPANWEKVESQEWVGLQGSMQYVFENFPDATQYGWLADDTRPRTKGWDRKLEKAADKWNLACAKDLWMSEIPGMLEQVLRGRDLTSGLCWGGELVRCVGWWALPGVKQAGIDTAWTEIIWPLNLHYYLDTVTVEHLNWRTGKRKYDETDRGIVDGVSFIDADITLRNEWVASRDYRDTLRRVGVAVGDPNETQAAVAYAKRESYANELFRLNSGRLPAARMLKVLEGKYDIDRIDLDSDPNERPARLGTQVRAVGAQPDVRRLRASDL